MKISFISTLLFIIFNVSLYAKPVYFRILNYSEQVISVSYTGMYPNLQKTTDNKAFWKNNERIHIDYRTSDRDHIYKMVNSRFIEGQRRREIKPCGFVVYKVDSKNDISDLQIELTLSDDAVKNGMILAVSKDENFPDSATVLLDTASFYTAGKNLKLDAFIDLYSLKTIYNGERWRGSTFADRFGMAECYWYDYVKPFQHNCEVKYWKYNSTDFFIDGKLSGRAEQGHFGADLEWTDKLEKGYIYTITTVLDSPPDYILINNEKLVWEKESGFYAEKSGELVFYYIPEEDEDITVSYVKNAAADYARLDLDAGYLQELYSTRRHSSEVSEYEKRTIDKKYVPIDHITLRMFSSYHNDPVVDIELEELPALDYTRSDFNVTPRGALAARTQVFDVISKLGLKDAVFRTDVSGDKFFQPEDFTIYRDAGIKNLDFMVFEKQNGKIANINPHWHANQLYDDNPVNTTADLMKKWLTLDTSHQAYLHFQEVNCLFGSWGKDITNTSVLSEYGYTNLDNKSKQELFQLHIDEIAKFSDKMEDRIGLEPDRVKRLLLPDRAALHAAYWAKAGADIILTKNIHRQSVNIVVANARGTADAYGIEYGFDLDLWDRCTRLGYHPDEFNQIYKVYFHSGGKYLIEEGIPQAPDQGKFSPMGKEWIDMAKYTRAHPPLGEQIVQIAVMRGFGDEWHTVGSPSSSWESGYYEKTVNDQNYLQDYNLLDKLFANYGTYWNTATDRLCTGTPYGPVDFIPWDAPPEFLNKYKLIVIMGFNTLEEDHLANLAQYVTQGGKLICAAGQIKNTEGDFYLTEELFGVFPGDKKTSTTEYKSLIPDKSTLDYKLMPKECPYYSLDVRGEKAEVIERLPDESPLLVKNIYGRGEAYLFSGEHLTEFGEELPGEIMANSLEEIKSVAITPSSDRIEYIVRKKGESIILPVFNHGNAGFPSGKTRLGNWDGEISINKEVYNLMNENLSVYRAVYNETAGNMELKKIPSENVNGKIVFNADVDTFEEYVIGPESGAEYDFFN